MCKCECVYIFIKSDNKSNFFFVFSKIWRDVLAQRAICSSCIFSTWISGSSFHSNSIRPARFYMSNDERSKWKWRKNVQKSKKKRINYDSMRDVAAKKKIENVVFVWWLWIENSGTIIIIPRLMSEFIISEIPFFRIIVNWKNLLFFFFHFSKNHAQYLMAINAFFAAMNAIRNALPQKQQQQHQQWNSEIPRSNLSFIFWCACAIVLSIL